MVGSAAAWRVPAAAGVGAARGAPCARDRAIARLFFKPRSQIQIYKGQHT
jgi:hypothetical protein